MTCLVGIERGLFSDVGPAFSGGHTMKAYVSTLATVAWLFMAPSAIAGDRGPAVAQVERAVAKEPAYQSGAPRYCLLAFGREAKFRVWLVQDGDALYVDRNGNGDLTEPGERIEKKHGQAGGRQWEGIELTDGPRKHTITTVSEMTMTEEYVGDRTEFARIKGKHDKAVNTWIVIRAERSADDDRKLPKHIQYIINGDGTGYRTFADRPQDGPVAHLNGPWTFGLQDIKQHVAAGKKKMLQLGVGTP